MYNKMKFDLFKSSLLVLEYLQVKHLAFHLHLLLQLLHLHLHVLFMHLIKSVGHE